MSGKVTIRPVGKQGSYFVHCHGLKSSLLSTVNYDPQGKEKRTGWEGEVRKLEVNADFPADCSFISYVVHVIYMQFAACPCCLSICLSVVWVILSVQTLHLTVYRALWYPLSFVYISHWILSTPDGISTTVWVSCCFHNKYDESCDVKQMKCIKFCKSEIQNETTGLKSRQSFWQTMS